MPCVGRQMLENLTQIFSVPVRAQPAWKIKGDAAF